MTNEILRLKLYNTAIQLDDILEVGNQRHLLCRCNENPCLECSLNDLCDAMQETGHASLCNELDDATFKDITQSKEMATIDLNYNPYTDKA